MTKVTRHLSCLQVLMVAPTNVAADQLALQAARVVGSDKVLRYTRNTMVLPDQVASLGVHKKVGKQIVFLDRVKRACLLYTDMSPGTETMKEGSRAFLGVSLF